ncbi:hypothetical protein QOZ80_2BG0180870 [Eleusine coracana subsp. coracana]|nr:hypothetical protein QOZ80_2BG0180870 [Eleusine coracana subsp. coracana]
MLGLGNGHGPHGFYDFIRKDILEKSEHLNDDCFKIRCDVIIPKEVHTEDRVATPALNPVPVPPSDLSHHLARSPVFKAQFFGGMTKQGIDTEVIRVHDMEAEAFEALLSFLYTDTLPEFPGERQSAMNQHLLVAADKYNLERLKLICEDNLCKHIETGTAATILTLAEQHNCNILKKKLPLCFKGANIQNFYLYMS